LGILEFSLRQALISSDMQVLTLASHKLSQHITLMPTVNLCFY